MNVTNTPSVSVTGTANVTTPLDNQLNPVPLAVSEAYHSFSDTCEFQFPFSDGGSRVFKAPPPGTRIVIQQFDAGPPIGGSFGLESGCKPLVVGLKTEGDFHVFPATFMGTHPQTNKDFYATHQETRLYGTPGQAPTCGVQLSSPSQAIYVCHISGFLVP